MMHIIGRSVLAVLAVFAVAGGASAGSITYYMVDMPEFQGGATISGSTFTTDGTIGDVSNHITGWSVDIDGFPAFSSTGENNSFFVGLIATATELYLPIPASTPGGVGEVILRGFSGMFLTNGLGWVVGGDLANPSFTYAFGGRTPIISHPPVVGSEVVIATTIPEPSSLIMLAISSL
jgi:hypothetical protein